jgi:uncharacterized protein YbaR (Trm112 family)
MRLRKKMANVNDKSILMQLCLCLGFERLAWSLRRLYCPVDSTALVLEVGSGGNPYFRSNVLLDAYEVTQQRHWAPLVTDRPTVLGTVERLPFRDQTFDFVIASHVLEHSADPGAFLAELQRVAKAGYIEVPDAFMERLNPYRDHRLEITLRDATLVIRKKASWQADPELVELYESRAKRHVAGETIPRHPFDFHLRYYWQGKIAAQILNPHVDAAWEASASSQGSVAKGFRARMNSLVLWLARLVFSQNRRNRALRLDGLLACPQCRSSHLQVDRALIRCAGCSAEYPVRNGLPVMFPPTTENVPR